MNSEDMIRQIIREELDKLVEQTAEPQRRSAVGRRGDTGKKKGSSARFYSAGTIPNVQNRKMTPNQVKNREQIGVKLLNLFRRGGSVGKDFREKIKNQLDQKNLPQDRKHQLSQIWANASTMALKGATAGDIKASGKKSKGSDADNSAD